MGHGRIKNGRPVPITPWVGSWAHQQAERRLEAARRREAELARFTAPIARRQPSPTVEPSQHRKGDE